jgi:cytochrome c553
MELGSWMLSRQLTLDFKREEKSQQEENSHSADCEECHGNQHENLPAGQAMNCVSSVLQFDWISPRLKHE